MVGGAVYPPENVHLYTSHIKPPAVSSVRFYVLLGCLGKTLRLRETNSFQVSSLKPCVCIADREMSARSSMIYYHVTRFSWVCLSERVWCLIIWLSGSLFPKLSLWICFCLDYRFSAKKDERFRLTTKHNKRSKKIILSFSLSSPNVHLYMFHLILCWGFWKAWSLDQLVPEVPDCKATWKSLSLVEFFFAFWCHKTLSYRENEEVVFLRKVKMEEKKGCIDPQSKVRYKKKGSGALGLSLWLSQPAWWVRGMCWSSETLGVVLLWGKNQL